MMKLVRTGEPVASRCSVADQRNPEFTDLDQLLHDAYTFEHLPDFVVSTTISMYLYLHPCLGTTEAAVNLFYKEKVSETQEAVIGRRRRAEHFNTDEEISAERFKQKHPNFMVPTSSLPTTTTTTTPTTPTTTTTTTSTTSSPSTTITTSATTTATSASTQTTSALPIDFGPLSCSSCTGLLCLLGNHVTKCPDGEICQTTIEDTDTGRQITRGCSPQSLCVGFHQHQNQTLCSQADHQILPSSTTCRYCCVSQDCNSPPHVIPPTDTLFPQTSSA